MKVRCFAERLVLMIGSMLLISTTLFSQTLLDEFTDGFDPSLNWQGDIDVFVGNAGRLQLDDMGQTPTSNARVWLAANTQSEACWTLDAELQFSPSASNKAIWWLAADRPLDQTGIQGYFLQLGGISGSDDAFELFEVIGSTENLILSGQVGGAAVDPVIASLQVCRTTTGDWNLQVADAAGSVIDQANGSSTNSLNGAFAGLILDFTSTRNGLFFFDNFGIDPIFIDQIAPTLVSATAIDARSVQLVASETLLSGTAAAVTNYQIGSNVVNVASLNGNTVDLILADDLVSGQVTPITISSWSDQAGNESTNLSASVTFIAPRQLAAFELLITELMPDPTPPIGLPDFEYIELFNAGSSPIDLSTVSLFDDGDLIELPAIMLDAQSYIALTEDAGGDSRFTSFPDFPTLTNSGGLLGLVFNGQIIDQVNYTPSWHEPSKGDGGFSLERKDLNQPCLLGQANWSSSASLSGGTPGTANSISTTIVGDSLQIIGVDVLGTSILLVRTNRVLRDVNGAFQFANGGGITALPSNFINEYQLELDEPLTQGVPRELTLTSGITSCLGSDNVSQVGVTIGIPDFPEVGDWELNEIMFDPLSGQGRWIELVNVSDKLLSTSGLLLARLNDDGTIDDLFEPFANILVPAGGFVVYANDVETLVREFPTSILTSIVPTDVPTIGSEECIQLFDPVNAEVYFTVCYTEDWHNQAFANTDGVSLERIDLLQLPQNASNWTSAAATVGFGTPTRPNSQARIGQTVTEGTFALASDVISPDGDGFEDLLSLDYTFGEAGVLARFEIIDLLGRSVLEANQDTSPGIAGTFTWDGVDNDGDLAEVGTYILRVTYFSPQTSREVENIAFSLLLRR